MQISTGKKPRAQKVVLYGPEGIGKTSLAAQFPDPLFIDTEGGTACYDVKRAEPAPTSWAMLMAYVDEAARGTARRKDGGPLYRGPPSFRPGAEISEVYAAAEARLSRISRIKMIAPTTKVPTISVSVPG